MRRSRVVEIRHMQTGKPDQNAYIERCNRVYREMVVNACLLESLDQVRMVTEEWMLSYN